MADSKGPFQFSWIKSTDVPCDITWCKTVTVGRDKETFIADYCNGLKMFVYHPLQDDWGFLLEKSSPPTLFFGIGGFRGELVLAGGKDVKTNEPSKLVSEWKCGEDLKGTANPLPAMTSPRSSPLVVGWRDHLIVAGGIRGGKQNIEIFNADKNVWKIAGTLPLPSLLSCAVVRDCLYVLGRANVLIKIPLEDLVSYIDTDPTPSIEPQWQVVCEAPFNNSTIFDLNNDHLLIAGGYSSQNGFSLVSDIYQLDTGDKWTLVGQLPQPCYDCCISWMPKYDCLFLMAGRDKMDDPLLIKKVWRTYNVLQKPKEADE